MLDETMYDLIFSGADSSIGSDYHHPLRQRAVELATELYEMLESYLREKNEIEAANDHGPFRIGSLSLRLRYYGPNTSRGMFWESGGNSYRLWFEVKGWVHYDRNERETIYRHVLFSQLPSSGSRVRPYEFEGSVTEFFSLSEKLLASFSKELGQERKAEGLRSRYLPYYTILRGFRSGFFWVFGLFKRNSP